MFSTAARFSFPLVRPLHQAGHCWCRTYSASADRTATVNFLTHALGMRALRHEEFQEGCKAACNGPYDGMWADAAS